MKVSLNKVTYDMYSSQEARQELNENGVNADYLSVDRTDEQYLALVNLIIEGRIRFYDYAPLRKELFELIWYRAKRKVDHPGSTATGGTKDLCDSLAGAVWNAINSNKSAVQANENTNLLFDANKSNSKDNDMEDFYNDFLRDAINEGR